MHIYMYIVHAYIHVYSTCIYTCIYMYMYNMLKVSAVIGYVSMVSMVLCTFSLQEELWWSGDLCELSHLPVPRRAERPPAVSLVKTAQQLVHTLCKTYGIMHVYGYTYSIYILVFHTAHPKQSPHMYTHTVQDIWHNACIRVYVQYIYTCISHSTPKAVTSHVHTHCARHCIMQVYMNL